MSARRRFLTISPRLLVLGAALMLSACDAAGVLVPAGDGRMLRSGLYSYQTWTSGGRAAGWGEVDVRVGFDGELSGWYNLPDQCIDGFGFPVDCVGRIGGRAYRDGTVRFGFDEGWLRHEGAANRFSEVVGDFEVRMVGYADYGEFELVPY